jgi:hypothetical protein
MRNNGTAMPAIPGFGDGGSKTVSYRPCRDEVFFFRSPDTPCLATLRLCRWHEAHHARSLFCDLCDLSGVNEDGTVEHIADRRTYSEILSLAKKLAPKVEFSGTNLGPAPS